MGKDYWAREQERLERPRSWWIAGPGIAALVIGAIALIVVSRSPEHLWFLPVIALVQAGLLVWTAVALAKVRGRRPLARTVGIAGIVAAAICIWQSLGFLFAMVLLSGAA